MAFTYTEKTTDLGWSYIEKIDSENPEAITYIPIDQANPDYQEYLKSLDEAASL